jgi:phosphotransferase system  glucose/maltose/N-acetylglucosamine-specific IIC component
MGSCLRDPERTGIGPWKASGARFNAGELLAPRAGLSRQDFFRGRMALVMAGLMGAALALCWNA